MHFFFPSYIKKSLSIKQRKAKFNKLSNGVNIKLIKGNRNFILYTNNYINNGKNLNEKPIDLSIKNQKIAFCSNLPFGMLSFSNYVDIESMNTISSDVDMNEYRLLGTKPKQVVDTLKLLKRALFMIFKTIKRGW